MAPDFFELLKRGDHVGLGIGVTLARQMGNAFKTAEFLNTLGQTYFYLSDYPRALAAYEEALPLWEQSLGGVPENLVAWNLNNIGVVQNIIGEKQKALTNQQKVKLVAEGVEAYTKYRGSVENVLMELTGGIRSGLAHSGAKNIAEFRDRGRLWLQSVAGISEGNPHSLEKILDQ